MDGWELRAEPVLRGGIAGTAAVVDVDEAHRHPHRRAVDIDELIAAAGLPARVEARALATFRLLAEVEGRLHGVPADQVHFHEVGAVDSIVDIVGVCVALELLDVDAVEASSVAQGIGHVPRRPTACCPTRPRRWWHCWPGPASPATASTCPSS